MHTNLKQCFLRRCTVSRICQRVSVPIYCKGSELKPARQPQFGVGTFPSCSHFQGSAQEPQKGLRFLTDFKLELLCSSRGLGGETKTISWRIYKTGGLVFKVLLVKGHHRPFIEQGGGQTLRQLAMNGVAVSVSTSPCGQLAWSESMSRPTGQIKQNRVQRCCTVLDRSWFQGDSVRTTKFNVYRTRELR